MSHCSRPFALLPSNLRKRIKLLLAGKGLDKENLELINLINKYLKQSEIEITVDLDIGVYEWTTWTCDFTKEYVSINADYRS